MSNILDSFNQKYGLNLNTSLFEDKFFFPKGSTTPKLYVVASSPNGGEINNEVFSSASYESLFKIFDELKINKEDCRFAYVSPFRPIQSGNGFGRQLEFEEATKLSKFVLSDIQKTNPKVILCLGKTVSGVFIGDDSHSVKTARGFEMDYNGIPLVFTYSQMYFSQSGSINQRDLKNWEFDINKAWKYEEFKSKKDSLNNLDYVFVDINEVEKVNEIFAEDDKVVLDYEASSLRPLLNNSFHIGGVGLFGTKSKKSVYVYIHDFFRRYKDFKPQAEKLKALGQFLLSKKLIVFNAQYECSATAKYLEVEIRDLEDVMMMGRMLSQGGGLKEIASRKLHLPVWTSKIDLWNDALESLLAKLKQKKKPNKDEYDNVAEIKFVVENNKTIFDIKEFIDSKNEQGLLKILKDTVKSYLLRENLDNPIVKKSSSSILKFWSNVENGEKEYFEKLKEFVVKKAPKSVEYNQNVLPLINNKEIFDELKEDSLTDKDIELIKSLNKFEEIIRDTFKPEEVESIKKQFTDYIVEKVNNQDYDINFAEIPSQIVAPYCVNDIIRTGELYDVLLEEIKNKNLEEVFDIYNNQMLLGVELENNGIAWDDEKASELQTLYKNIVLQSGKDMILSDRMKRILQLTDQDELIVQSAVEFETITPYFNPLNSAPQGGTKANLSKAISSPRFKVMMMLYAVHKVIFEEGEDKVKKTMPLLYDKYKEISSKESFEEKLQYIQDIIEQKTIGNEIINSDESLANNYAQHNIFKKYQQYELEDTSSDTINDLFNGFITILKINPSKKEQRLEEFEMVVNFKIYKRAIKFLGSYIQAKLGRGNVYVVNKEDVKKPVFKRVGSYDKGDRKTSDQVYINESDYGVCTAETRRWKAGVHSVPSNTELMDLRVSRFDGGIRLKFDYSQMEVRVLAAISHDVELLKLFEDDSTDIHRMIASKVFKKAPEEITDTERKFAKGCTFGILYGKSVYNFAEEMLNGDIKYAQEIFDSLFNSFPGIKSYIKESHLMAMKDGKVKTMFGDELYVGMPEVVFKLTDKAKEDLSNDPYSKSVTFSSNRFDDSRVKTDIGKALRDAQNFRIQSTASSIAGLSIYNMYKCVREKGLTSKVDCFTHDAGEIDMEFKDLPYLIKILKQEAIEEPKKRFGIPLNVDYSIGVSGNNLLDLEECVVLEDDKTIKTKFYGKKKGFEAFLNLVNKNGFKIEYTIKEETIKDVSLKELFKPKGEYPLGQNSHTYLEGEMTLFFENEK